MMQKNRYWVLAVFVIAVLATGLLVKWLTAPDDWYEGLAKPSFNPPNWIFGPVWTGLYLPIAVAGWRLWCRAPASSAMRLWFAQMGLNWLWSPTFFGLQAPTFALIIILVSDDNNHRLHCVLTPHRHNVLVALCSLLGLGYLRRAPQRRDSGAQLATLGRRPCDRFPYRDHLTPRRGPGPQSVARHAAR